MLLVLRLGIAAAALGLVFARRRPFRTFLRRDLWPRFLLMGLLDGGSLLAYFFAIRETGVAVATFLLFVQPVWVALLAPRLLKAPTEKLVYLALGVAVAGLGVIMAPGLTGGGLKLSAAGVAAGLAAGVLYAFFQLLVKDLTKELPSTTIVTLECTLDAVVILPLALVQWTTLGVVLTGRDWIRSHRPGAGLHRGRVLHLGRGRGPDPGPAQCDPRVPHPRRGAAVRVGVAGRGGHAGDRRGGRPDPGRGRSRGVVGRPGGGAGAAAVSGASSTPSAAVGPAVTTLRRRDPLGYAIVIVSYLGMAGSAPLVAWADAPEAIILCLRMAFAALALGVVFLRRPMLADWRRPGAAWRLLLMAAMSSLTLLLFFYAVRNTSVAIAMFMLFLMPVWVALAAPRLFKSPREPVAWRRSPSPSPASQ